MINDNSVAWQQATHNNMMKQISPCGKYRVGDEFTFSGIGVGVVSGFDDTYFYFTVKETESSIWPEEGETRIYKLNELAFPTFIWNHKSKQRKLIIINI